LEAASHEFRDIQEPEQTEDKTEEIESAKKKIKTAKLIEEITYKNGEAQ
jgi:hypothetical protein